MESFIANESGLKDGSTTVRDLESLLKDGEAKRADTATKVSPTALADSAEARNNSMKSIADKF